MSNPSKIASLMTAADTAYDAQDVAWFEAQATEDLTALWGVVCANLSGASWDDEVYDALADRGWFEDEDDTTNAHQTVIHPRPDEDAECNYCESPVAFEVSVSGISKGQACRAHVGDLAGNIAKGRA